MKKILVVLLVLACIMGCTGCICGHQWIQASCLEAKNCPLCGKVEGAALGHRWVGATCLVPITCSACGQTQGETADHRWTEATCHTPKICQWCGQTEGDPTPHAWKNATTEAPATCSACGETQGNPILTDSRFTTAANRVLFGQWETAFTMAGQELNLADYVEEIRFVAVVSFEEDGSLRLQVRFQDKDAFIADVVAQTREKIYLQFEGMDIPRPAADVMFEDVYGMSLAEYAANVWAEADWDAMLEMYGDEYVYYAENGKLNIADSWETAFESRSYKLVGNRLTLTAADGTSVELTRAK